MSQLVLCREIRRVEGGWIVEARWPYGGEPMGYGEVICKTLDEVTELVRRCAGEPPAAKPEGGGR